MKKPITIKKQHIAPLLGSILVIAGIITGYQPLQRALAEQRATASAFIEPPVQSTDIEIDTKYGIPSQLSIPALSIELAIAEGLYNSANNTWTLSGDEAHYAVNSAPANTENGNTFIYGHNNSDVFAELYKLKEGDKALVKAEDGTVFVYEYYALTITGPRDTSIFEYSGSPILTLQTCSGSWYENRSLYAFSLVEVL